MSRLIESLASLLGKNALIHRFLMDPYVRFYVKPMKNRYIRRFHRYGLQALKEFTDCLDTNGYPYVLFGGTMLGAIREHGFIKHDLDMDTAMWYSDYNPKMIKDLSKIGFKVYHSYSVENDHLGKELTFEYKRTGVRIDVFFFYPPIKGITSLPYHCDFMQLDGMKKNQRCPRRLEYPFNHNRRKASFEGVELYIPENAEELCEFRYGKDYMIPNPKWSWRREKSNVTEWPEMIDHTLIS